MIGFAKAEKGEPMADLIERQAAIDAIEPTLKSILMGNSFKAINVMDKIRDLPSAQPDIVYCCDCRRYHPSFCEVWSKFGTVITNEFDFCSRGERRTE